MPRQKPKPLLAEPPRARAPAPTLVRLGVYLNANRNSSIVVGVKQGVHAIIMPRSMADGDKDISVIHCSHERFAADYPVALPHYPSRRAARIYLRSHIAKAPEAERLLRALLAR